MAARPQVSVYNTEGAATGELPLPAVLTVSSLPVVGGASACCCLADDKMTAALAFVPSWLACLTQPAPTQLKIHYDRRPSGRTW